MGREIRGKGLFNEVMAFVVTAVPDGVAGPLFHTGFASLPGSMRALTNAGWTRLAGFRVRKALLTPRPLRERPLGRLLAPLLGLVWGAYRAWQTAGAGNVVVRPVVRFTEDMDRFQPADRIHGDRSARFLNWRVIDNPRDDLRAFTFHGGDATLGYAVCKVLPETWEVVELRCTGSGHACAAALLRHLHAVEHAPAADFWLLEGFLQEDRLPRGLLDRGMSGAMFVHGVEAVGLTADPGRWAGSYLDSDW